MNYSEKLRDLADWLDRHPEIRDEYNWNCPRVNVYLGKDRKEDFSKLVRSMGNVTKDGYAGQISAEYVQRDIDDEYERVFAVEVSISGVCERVQATNEDGTPKVTVKRAYVETDETEPVYEWHCPESFLNLGKDA